MITNYEKLIYEEKLKECCDKMDVIKERKEVLLMITKETNDFKTSILSYIKYLNSLSDSRSIPDLKFVMKQHINELVNEAIEAELIKKRIKLGNRPNFRSKRGKILWLEKDGKVTNANKRFWGFPSDNRIREII